MEKLMIAFLVICAAWVLWDLVTSYKAYRHNKEVDDAIRHDREANGV